MKKGWLLMIFVFSVFVLTACGSQKVSINMDMKEYVFIPDTIEVPAGAEVTINLSNSGTLEHEMVIMVFGKEATAPFDEDDETNIYWEHELEAGDNEVVSFTAPSEPGEYQMVCGIPAHLEQGMVGKLIIK
jgi:plastocyanin